MFIILNPLQRQLKMALVKKYIYPLDTTGTAISNRVAAERQTISPGQGAAFNFFIPKAGPYFGESLQVRHVATNQWLTRGLDFEPSYLFFAAAETAQTGIYGAVTILNTAYVGTFEITYQSLGGTYTYDEQSLLQILAATQLDPRTTRWDNIIGDPSLFPSDDHLHHMSQSYGYESLVAIARELLTKFTMQTGQIKDYIDAHKDDLNNPHQVNLLLLGIERFENVYLSPIQEMLTGTNNINYASPAGVKAVVDALLARIQTEHYNQINPHGTTKIEVGLPLVENWRPADQAQADQASPVAYATPGTVAYMLQQRIAQLPLALIETIKFIQDNHIANFENPHKVQSRHLGIPLANFTVGPAGTVPFHNGSSQPFDYTASMILNDVAVVTDDRMLQAQLVARSSFNEVFNTWQRFAFQNGNPMAQPSELNSWTYNPTTDKIECLINSVSYLGFMNPDKTHGNYEFEVLLSSTDADDDFIGVCIGMEPIGNSYRALFVARSATIPGDGGGRFQLIGIDSTSGKVPIDVRGLPSFANGWLGYNALGPVKLKVIRVGTLITIYTSDAGADYGYNQTFDLATDEWYAPFRGPVNLGYFAMSQGRASWQTVRRTGAQPVIAATHSNKVYEWDGVNYNLTARPLTSVLLPGRYYRNTFTKRTYFSGSAGSAYLVSASGSYKDFTSSIAVLDRLIYVGQNGDSASGKRNFFYDQDPTTGVTNPLGGVGAADATKLGFFKSDGSMFGYFAADGYWYHNGSRTLSDPTVKTIVEPIQSLFNADALDVLNIQHWEWHKDPRVDSTLQGTLDLGLLTTQVKAVCPHLVSINPDGLETYDVAKLALLISLTLNGKLQRLVKLTDSQWNKLLKLLED